MLWQGTSNAGRPGRQAGFSMGAMQAAKLLAELGTGERLLSARARTPALL